jgi:hypothetical protein
MLAESEAALFDRNQYLEDTVQQLTAILADLAYDRAHFETLARGWICELAAQRQTNQQLREELRRFTAAQVPA